MHSIFGKLPHLQCKLLQQCIDVVLISLQLLVCTPALLVLGVGQQCVSMCVVSVQQSTLVTGFKVGNSQIH
jgi:hypothetical protein